MVPLSKMSKKRRKAENAKRRVFWKINPSTRKSNTREESRRKFQRKLLQKSLTEYIGKR